MTSGLVVVDKPVGPSSFAAVARLRRLYHERQAGHAGTLDPLASGVLPVLLGEGTKLVPWLMGLDKEYVATARLGAATDTYDAEGRITATAPPERLAAIDEGAVRAALAGFVGRIAQRPPVYSAIKKDGQRLYALARADVAVEPEAREVQVYELVLEAFDPPLVRFRVRCGKGTYVRSLAHDLGERLGVGAHLAALRRTRVGPLDLDGAVDPFAAAFDDPAVRPPAPRPLAVACAHLPAVNVDDEGARALRQGKQAPLGAFSLPQGAIAVRVLDPMGALVAIAEPRGARLVIGRVFAPAP